MRKDAERNRRKLIEAASATMRESGGDVPMEMIAERASLTRGTLYRNFPHRQALYEAVLENDLAELMARIAEDGDADPLAFIRRMTELMSVYDKFLVALSDMPDYDFAANQDRMVQALQGPLDAAKARGALHPHLTGEDILLACRMLASPLHLDGEPDRAKALDRRLALMLRGLGGRSPGPAGQV
ncbi:MAG: TetR/AcrR family transcriptional regulator [Parafilimonas terrae]|nr:TetR/AcrR family transcriptional regulator [Parafilimonas terrae]